jgi:ATP-dependent exoDNAse (exonuclease V) beta subunit
VSPDLQKAGKIVRLKELDEAKRLAYVAATRARNGLSILTPPSDDLPSEVADYLNTQQQDPAGSSLQISAVESPESIGQSELPSSWELDLAEYRKIWEDRETALSTLTRAFHRPTDVSTEPSARPPLFRSAPPNSVEASLLVGKVAHTYLERHATDSGFDKTAFDALVHQEETFSLKPDRLSCLERALRQFFEGKTVDDRGQPYCERVRSAQVLGREVPFYVHFDDRPWHGVIDLILDDGSSVCAVDYKTGNRPDLLPSAYQTQQTVYVSALRQLFPGREIKFEFWWIEQEGD